MRARETKIRDQSIFLTIFPLSQSSTDIDGRRAEREIVASAERRAGYLGMDRRQFLRTSCGMALAFAAMNSVFGHFFRVEATELSDPAAVAENKARFFIFDVQTHHVAMPNQAPRADQDFLKAVVGMRDMARKMNPALKEGYHVH